MRIGIFDSGIGGLTVLKYLLEHNPNNQYIYFGDTINLPYGSKTKEQLLNYSNKIIEFFITKKVDIIIIACGTVSSNIHEQLKNKYSIPIIDIITPTIEYIKHQNYKKIGVIGTNMTIESNIFYNKLKYYDIEVISQKCPAFVPLIENNKMNTIEYKESLKEYLNIFKSNNIETIILGCTHYPIIQNQIEQYTKINTLNMATCLSPLVPNNNDLSSLELYFSKINETLQNNANKILNDNHKLNLKKL